MKILICNAGSTSLKFRVATMPGEITLAQGKVERVGSDRAIFHYSDDTTNVHEEPLRIPDYASGISRFLEHLSKRMELNEIEAVGFKTVLAKDYYGVHELTEEVKAGMRAFLPVAPVHNSCYLEAIRVFETALPEARRIGVFETDFHRTIPLAHRVYPIPYEWYEKYGVMRMGYHGASHGYIARKLSGKRRVISCHLGGSSSLCAIKDGKSIDNSFGLSLQAGIPHSVRTGDLDVYVLTYLEAIGLSREEIMQGLEKRGGLCGLSGTSGDMRDIEDAIAAGSERAQLALDILVTHIVRYIGAYTAELEGVDAIVFTAGIGENSALLRKMVCEKLRFIGIEIDAQSNEKGVGERKISSECSSVEVYVIPTNEESMVLQRAYEYLIG